MRLPSSVFAACLVFGSANAPLSNDDAIDVRNVQSVADAVQTPGVVLPPPSKDNCHSTSRSISGGATQSAWSPAQISYCCKEYAIACPNARFFVALTKAKGVTRHISPDDVKATLEKELPVFKSKLFVDYARATGDESKFRVIVTERLRKDQIKFLSDKIGSAKLNNAVVSDIKGTESAHTEFDTRFHLSEVDMLEAVFEILLHAVAFGLGLYVWNKKVYPEKQQVPEFIDTLGRGDFKSNICGCMNDSDSCVHGCVAPIPRLVDNYLTAGAIRRSDACSTASVLFCCLVFLPTALFPFCCYMPYKRAKVRRKLGGRKTWCIDDLLATTVCFCCHVCQMAREVDRAAGWKTTVVCDVREVDRDEVTVGHSVSVASRRYSRLSGGGHSPVSSNDERPRRPSRVSHANSPRR